MVSRPTRQSSFLSLLVLRQAICFSVDVSVYLFFFALRIYCSKVAKVRFFPIKRLPILPPHGYEVRVLLQELYPDQGQVLGATAFCRGDPSEADDYLLAINKIGLNDIDEINFLFQTNHLPIAMFCSTSSVNDVVGACSTSDITNSSMISTPRFGFELSAVQDSTSIVSTQNVPTSEVNRDSASTESTKSTPDYKYKDVLLNASTSMDISPVQEPPRKTQNSFEPLASEWVDSKVCVTSKLGSGDDCRSNVSNSSNYDSQASPSSLDGLCGELTPLRARSSRISTASSVSSCCDEFSFSNYQPYTQFSNGQLSVFNGPLVKDPFQNQLNDSSFSNQKWRPVLKTLPSQITSSGPFFERPLVSDTLLWRKLERNCGKVEDFLVESHFSDGSDDSEGSDEFGFYRRSSFSLPRQARRTDSFRSLSCGSINSSFLAECSDSSCGPSSTYFLTDAQDFERSDRNIRDIQILHRLQVPFTYDQVAYSSNEVFREIKATSGLTVDQITAMLDARRRATNRQAAERCRRVKSAVRNSLASQLDRLRLERATLSKRLIRTRKRRQQARDELTTTQQDLIKVLVGPDGSALDPSQWRVQTTAKGEWILVRTVTKS